MTTVAIEARNVERFVLHPDSTPVTAERREQALVHDYQHYLEERGCEVVRHRYVPDGEAKPLFCDLFNATRRQLLEAKGTGTREAIRMAIGQLADYGRLEPDRPDVAVLLPERPRPDLEQLLRHEGITAVWQDEGDGFQDNAGGHFT